MKQEFIHLVEPQLDPFEFYHTSKCVAFVLTLQKNCSLNYSSVHHINFEHIASLKLLVRGYNKPVILRLSNFHQVLWLHVWDSWRRFFPFRHHQRGGMLSWFLPWNLSHSFSVSSVRGNRWNQPCLEISHKLWNTLLKDELYSGR